MKKTFLTALLALFLAAQNAFAVVDLNRTLVSDLAQSPETAALPADFAAMPLDRFLSLTPAKYRELTGKKLGWRHSLVLRAAQRSVKKQLGDPDREFPKGLYVLATFFFLGWLVMGILDGWTGKNWWAALYLTLLCCVPGVIFSLAHMRDYYRK